MDLRSQVSCFLLFFFAFQNTSVLANDGRVGDIRYSILSEEQFQELHGKDWELLRGQEVPFDSALKNFWRDSHLPDARGVFLRGSNHGRPRKEGNPEGHLPIGQYQSDTFKKHDHGGGNHHHQSFLELTASRNSDGRQMNTAAYFPPRHQPIQTNNSGAIIKAEGDAETRPRNITVNVFIKIKETQVPSNLSKTDQKLEWTPEQIATLMNTPEFQNSLSDALQNLRKGKRE
ncbi:MAG: hypothetical protein ACO3A2_04730 [Bdellovibrionia bacterium]